MIKSVPDNYVDMLKFLLVLEARGNETKEIATTVRDK